MLLYSLVISYSISTGIRVLGYHKNFFVFHVSCENYTVCIIV